MIRFLKRHVWPWAEIERLREYHLLLWGEISKRDTAIWDKAIRIRALTTQSRQLGEDNRKLLCRLAKYERPRDESGRFTSNG